MPAPVKRFLLIVLVLCLSFASARGVDLLITKYEHNMYPLGDSDGMRETISKYSEEYDVPEEIIYTVIHVRSRGNRSYNEHGRIGFFGLSRNELDTVGRILGISVTSTMAKKPSYNLLFGVTYLKYLYSSFGDWNSVYAALLCGRDELLEWGSDRSLIDVTGSLVALPEGHEQTDAFKYYLDVERKYVELYFSHPSERDQEKDADTTAPSNN
jgi:hypothetical protein